MKKFLCGTDKSTERIIFVSAGLISLITIISVGLSLVEDAKTNWNMTQFFLALAFLYGASHLILVLLFRSVRGLLTYLYGDYTKLEELTPVQLRALSKQDSYHLVTSFPERVTHTFGVFVFSGGIVKIIVDLFNKEYDLSIIGTWITISAFGLALMQIIETAAKSRLDNRRQEVKLEEMIEKSNEELIKGYRQENADLQR